MNQPIDKLKQKLENCYVEAECGFSGYSAKDIKPIYDDAVLLELEVIRLVTAAKDAYEAACKAEATAQADREEKQDG